MRKTEYHIEATHKGTKKEVSGTCHTAYISSFIKLLGSYGWIVGKYEEYHPRVKG
jgi:hypothetical protein